MTKESITYIHDGMELPVENWNEAVQEVHHLGFECCLVGEQSIGKSALTRMQNVLISKVIEKDDETRAKSDEYADKCIAMGEGKEKPKDPHYGTRIMMPSTTKAQFYQLGISYKA